MSGSAEGWFPDPFGRFECRYWDGLHWTEHVASAGQQSVDAPVASAPATGAWYPDPFGRYEDRYWDGSRWTEHVASGGRQSMDPPGECRSVVSTTHSARPNKKMQRAVATVGVDVAGSPRSGSILTETVLVVSQKAKIFEVSAEYTVFDRGGYEIGKVREVGRNLFKKAVGVLPDSARSYRLQVLASDGRLLMTLTRPTSLVFSKLIVRDGEGNELGHIAQKSLGLFGRVRFNLVRGDSVLGTMTADNWDAWDFSLQESSGREIGRITKTWAGFGTEMFTKGDNYVVEIDATVGDDLRALLVAAALAVDIALRQEDT